MALFKDAGSLRQHPNQEGNVPKIKRLLGREGSQGQQLGLSADQAYNIIKSVGNCGEIFEHDLGTNTMIGLERGLNALWTKGGLQYSAPFR